MGNEFVTPSRAPQARRNVDNGHLTCPVCQRTFPVSWNAYTQAIRWRRAQKPVDELGADDPYLVAEADGRSGDGLVSGDSEFISHDELVLQLAEAVRVGILMPHERAVLTAIFTIMHRWRRLSWRAVAALAGCSPERARRAVLPALHRWHTLCRRNDRLQVKSSNVRIRIRGSRHGDVWTRHTFRLGSRRVSWSERVTDPEKRRAALRTRDKQIDRIYRPLPTTRMRSLGMALVLNLSGLEIPDDEETQRLKDSQDWKHNIQRAERKLRRARSRTTRPIISVVHILRVLAHGNRLCRACHTPILAGCRIDGHTITRGREFCCDACKMQVQRRRGRLEAGRILHGVGG